MKLMKKKKKKKKKTETQGNNVDHIQEGDKT